MKYAPAVLVLLIAFCAPGLARADEPKRISPVTDATTAKECGSCHMPFPAAFLPERSWRALMANLSDHFGEDASLPDDKAKAILGYLTAQAGDRTGSKLLRGLDPRTTPLRISDLPRWRKEHEEELSPDVWARPSIKSRSNCAACHVNALKGDYSKRSLRVPKS